MSKTDRSNQHVVISWASLYEHALLQAKCQQPHMPKFSSTAHQRNQLDNDHILPPLCPLKHPQTSSAYSRTCHIDIRSKMVARQYLTAHERPTQTQPTAIRGSSHNHTRAALGPSYSSWKTLLPHLLCLFEISSHVWWSCSCCHECLLLACGTH